MEESLEQRRETTGATSLTIVRALNAARRWAIARSSSLVCALLLFLMSLNMLSVLWHKSITIDEIAMIPAAYYHLVVGNFQLVNDHPPLSKIIAAVPLLFIQPAEAQPKDIPAPHSPGAKWAYLERFWEDNRASFEAISFWTRVPMIALTVALGILIFVFARKLFGARAAVLAVALYSLEPTVLAHGRVVQTDVPAAFGYLLVAFTLYRYLLAPAWRNALWLGVAVGVAILAKFSMLIVGPILTVTFVVLLLRAPRIGYVRKTLTAHAAIVTLAALFVIHAAYYFHSRALTEADALWIADSFPSRRTAVSMAVRAFSYVLPTDMVLGVFWQVWHNGQGHPGSLLGMYRATGWWYYFPVAFALKVPLPFLLLSLASLAWTTHAFITRRDKRFLVVLIPFALYTVFVLFSRINIGVRYYLPAFPFLFIAAGAFLDWLWRRQARRAGLALAAAVLCWTAVEAVRAYPNQMSYFNQLAASRPHWWYLSDSNVEWGDDVKRLAEYLHARGESRVSGAFLSGYLTPRLYGIEYVDLLAPANEVTSTRYAAVGASFLNGSTVPGYRGRNIRLSESQRINFFDAYRNREPEIVLGNSIYLYRVHE